MDTIGSTLTKALEEMTKRRPTPMEIQSMAASISNAIETEIDKRVARAIAERESPPAFGRVAETKETLAEHLSSR